MNDGAQSFLIFTLSGARYAVALPQVAEVIDRAVTWPIPLAPGYYHGAMNYHGSIVAVMDLAHFLGRGAGSATGKVIVLTPGIASLAFMVESIVRITPLGQADLLDAVGDHPFAAGELILPEGRAILLDAEGIATRAAETIND